MRRHSLLFAVGLAASVLLLASRPGIAEDYDDRHQKLPGADLEYPLRSREVTVEDALRLFSRNLRIGLTIEEGFVATALTDLTVDGSRQDYLEELAALYDFGWYFDGAVLHIFSIAEMKTQLYPLQQTTGSELISILKSLGVYQAKYFHRADTRRQALLVSGPPSYVETVGKLVEALEQAKPREVKVLRGSTGNVSQTSVSQGNASVATAAEAAGP
jgi:type II secretory pathway component GspD/PulD (secretin)